MFGRRCEESEREFLRTLSEDPDLVLGYVRSSLPYVTVGRLDEARDTLLRAKQIASLA